MPDARTHTRATSTLLACPLDGLGASGVAMHPWLSLSLALERFPLPWTSLPPTERVRRRRSP